MLDSYWKSLKSGSDIRGVALNNDHREPVTFTDDTVRRLAGGFLCWIEECLGCTARDTVVAIGRDSRLSGKHISDILTGEFCLKYATSKS